MTRRMLASKIAPLLLESSNHSTLVKQLAAYLIEEGQIAEVELLMNDVALELERLGYSEVQLVGAHVISSSVKEELVQIIKAQTGAVKVSLNETIDQSLIGGIIATTPSAEIDLSVRSKLKMLTAS